MVRGRLAGLLALAALSAVLALVAAPGGRGAPPAGANCEAVGGGSICHFSDPDSYGPVDTGISCGSGQSAFDIFDQGINNGRGTAWFDQNGDLTKITTEDIYSFGQWSNPLTGATVSYTQHNVSTFDLAVPGDITSATWTITGENIYRAPTGAPVLISVGRQVFNFDQSQLISSHGPNAFIRAFYLGDPSAFDQICAALGV
jgi:hypothetical protein